jgi:hypothetical protein
MRFRFFAIFILKMNTWSKWQKPSQVGWLDLLSKDAPEAFRDAQFIGLIST